MAAFRAVIAAVAVGVSLIAASTTSATPLDDCAQRVIRDWYSGGRVDGVYPLPCYRAAIRALPADVLQYSDADRDISSALAYARQKRRDASRAAAAQKAARAKEQDAARKAARSTSAAKPVTKTTAKPRREPASAVTSPLRRPVDTPVRIASAPDPTGAAGTVPYPLLVLAALAAILLLSGGAGWVVSRRRRPASDR